MKQLFFLLLVVYSLYTKAQTTTLTFTTQDTVTVHIHKPIDGSYNIFHCTTSLQLYPGQDATFRFEMEELGTVFLRYSTGVKCSLFVYPNANITVNYNNGLVSFGGDGAAGNKFYRSRYSTETNIYEEKRRNLFSRCIKTHRELSEAWKVFTDSIPHVNLRQVDSLYAKGEITTEMAHMIKEDTRYFEYDKLTDLLQELLYRRNEERELEKRDTVLICEMLDSIFVNNPPHSCLHAYGWGRIYSTDYYRHMYGKLSNLDKKKLLGKYDAATFGDYKHCLLMPPRERCPTLFSCLEGEYLYGEDTIGKKKMSDYFSEEFPESESYSIMLEIWEKHQREDNEGPVVITDTVNSLKELSALSTWKGKYVFIDLWATWCIPCRMQFIHNAELHQLLSQYSNLSFLYVSIDDNEEKWTKDIAKLPGLHLRASRQLAKDIEDKVFVNSRFSIPRYILLSPTGDVINGDMPYPSNMDALKKALKEALKGH